MKTENMNLSELVDKLYQYAKTERQIKLDDIVFTMAPETYNMSLPKLENHLTDIERKFTAKLSSLTPDLMPWLSKKIEAIGYAYNRIMRRHPSGNCSPEVHILHNFLKTLEQLHRESIRRHVANLKLKNKDAKK